MRTIRGSFILLAASLVISACIKDEEPSNLPGVAHTTNFCPTSADLPETMVSDFKSIAPTIGGILIRTGSDSDRDLLIDGSEHMIPKSNENGRQPTFYRGGCSSYGGLTIHFGNKKSFSSMVLERLENGDYVQKNLYKGQVTSTRTIKRPRPPQPTPPPPRPTPPTPPPPPPPPTITIPRHNVDQCPRQDDFGTGADNGGVVIMNIANGITIADPDHETLQIDGTILSVPNTKTGATYAGGCDNRKITIQFLDSGVLKTMEIKPNGHGYDKIITDDKGSPAINETYPKVKGN